MTRSVYILAHDLGTTGNKATLFEADTATPAAAVFEPYPTAYPSPGWAEQEAADWEQAVARGTRSLLEQTGIPAGAVAAVSFSGHMNGALLVDAAGAPLRPALIWADVRASEEEQALAERCGVDEVYHCTGHHPSASCTAAKVLWVKNHQLELYTRTAQVLQAKDYAIFTLTGVMGTDYSDASATNLFDIGRRTWATDIMVTAGLDPAKFPPASPSAVVAGTVTPEAAARTGLLTGTPVIRGGGDGACACVGAGCIEPGDTYTNIGSSAWIATTSAQPLADPQRRTITFMHLDPRYYFPLGVMQCAGGSFDWLERLLRGDIAAPLYRELDAAAGAVPPGAQGLLFLPYLIGERSPYWNSLARGAFVGLSMAHGRAEMARAVYEGVALNLKLILDAFVEQGVEVEAMRLIGGGARSAIWRQILADVLELPILMPALLAEATSLGAAIAGGVGVGLYPGYAVARQFVQAHTAEQPAPAARARYNEVYPLFQKAYEALESLFPKLAA